MLTFTNTIPNMKTNTYYSYYYYYFLQIAYKAPLLT